MENNLFDFATSELSQDAFLCWCLNWYNSPEATLYPMAKDVLALLGVTASKQDKKLIIRQQFYKIDILVVLPAQNLAVIIEDKTFTSEHDNQIGHYKKTLQALPAEERTELKLGDEPKIHTVFFKTGFHYDRDKATVADNKVGGPAFLAVLKKYKNKSEILDDYIDYLQRNIKWYEDYGKYDDTKDDDFRKWNIARWNIAQYNFMRDMLREKYPEAEWKPGSDLYKISSGTNIGGRPWTEFSIAKSQYPDRKDYYTLFWRVDTNKDGPYMSLRFYERFKDEKEERHQEKYNDLRRQAEELLNTRTDLDLSWEDVKGRRDTRSNFESTILSINLKDSLKQWDNKKALVQKQILAITDCFAPEQ